ncbi:MAG: RNA polymerase sigma-70 factor [Armatimonadetes bacterium]|nr:MAG: RNA polymerase sigma-70 factor [Armatimonadota bacterium]
MDAEIFERNRGRLESIAYGMLGSVMEAEDVVQDAYLRWAEVDVTEIDSPPAFLTTVTTRLAIDRLRSAQRRREKYVGAWLPEPILSSFEPDPADIAVDSISLSMAAMAVLERLNPVERAVLLLRDVFDLDYAEIANIVDKSPDNVRQIARRARGRAGDLQRAPVQTEVESQLISRYLEAIGQGDLEGLTEIFAEDVLLVSDGGGKARAARHPLHGARRVARHLIGVSPQAPEGMEVRIVRVNGEPSVMGVFKGHAIGIVTFEVRDGLITAVRASLNPDKLAHLSDV